ncbi:MAG: GxxExxY protein [Candidatus Neomarinimicrobiota bacterium]|nr:MAG: GxxExxY protein [Candidatus Neomarinimicrobiota bacterium]
MNTDYIHKELTEKIIKGFYEVYNDLGFGFLESVYEKSLSLVLNEYGLDVKSQYPIIVNFRTKIVGEFRADLVVEDKIIVELKAVKTLLPEHEAQLLNYLKATRYEVGLLLNFGNRPQIKRLIFDNKRKISHKIT